MIFVYFLAYQIAQMVAIPFVFIYLLWRRAKGKPVFGNVVHRLGFLPRSRAVGKKVIWVHAVSAGEVLATQSLIQQIKLDENKYVYLTTGTQSAYALAKKQIPADMISYLPFDFFIPMLIGFWCIRPNALIVVEAELWPNLLMFARLFRLNMYLVNARIPLKSKARYFKLAFPYRFLFNLYDHIYTQSADDHKLFSLLGVKESKITTLGNIKAFNVLQKVHQQSSKEFTPARIERERIPVLLAGSIHPGELDYYVNLYKEMKEKGLKLKLILAPRHFHWQDELVAKIEALGDSFAVWDTKSIRTQKRPDELPKLETIIQKREIENGAQTVRYLLDNADIVVVCVMGKLFDIYQLSDIFFLGGTFVTVGGHNLLEPCVWEKPSIVGPHYENCYDSADSLEQHNALIKVKTQEELNHVVEALLKNPDRVKEMGSNAHEWLVDQAGQVRKNLNHLIESLS